MVKRIHFEDDIFYLNLLVRTFKDGLELDLDADIFLNKIIDDLTFLDATFERMLENLSGNERLLDRNEQLLNLQEVEERFADALAKIMSGRGTLSEALSPFSERFAELRARSLRRRSEIEGAKGFQPDGENDQDLVSPFEMNELLKDS